MFPAITEALDLLEAALTRDYRRQYEQRCERLMRRMFRYQKAVVLMRPQQPSATGIVANLGYIDRLAKLLATAYDRGYGDNDRDLQEDADPALVSAMRHRAAQRISGINDITRAAVQALIEQAQRENWAYTKLATALRRQFAEFSATRAKLIAVTEIGQAYTDGQMAAAQKRERLGVTTEKKWNDSGDGRVSDGCRQNSAQGWLPLAQAFSSGHQSPLRFPGCRCSMSVRRADR